ITEINDRGEIAAARLALEGLNLEEVLRQNQFLRDDTQRKAEMRALEIAEGRKFAANETMRASARLTAEAAKDRALVIQQQETELLATQGPFAAALQQAIRNRERTSVALEGVVSTAGLDVEFGLSEEVKAILGLEGVERLALGTEDIEAQLRSRIVEPGLGDVRLGTSLGEPLTEEPRGDIQLPIAAATAARVQPVILGERFRDLTERGLAQLAAIAPQIGLTREDIRKQAGKERLRQEGPVGPQVFATLRSR
ncbi:hypothetical protein LCGC14_2851260, partial [marine sediment metagenome]